MTPSLLSLVVLAVPFFVGVAAAQQNQTDYFSNPEFQIYSINEKQYQYFIPYSVTNSKVEKMELDCLSYSLIVTLEPRKEQGELVIDIPRGLLDGRTDNFDEMFFVLVDGEEVDYLEIKNDSDSKTLSIQINNTKKVEIILSIIIANIGKSFINCGAGGPVESPYYELLEEPELPINLEIIFVEKDQVFYSGEQVKLTVRTVNHFFPGNVTIILTDTESGQIFEEKTVQKKSEIALINLRLPYELQTGEYRIIAESLLRGNAYSTEKTIQVYKEKPNPYLDDEALRLASDKVPLGGLGISFFNDPLLEFGIITVGIVGGAGLAVGLLFFWRKKK